MSKFTRFILFIDLFLLFSCNYKPKTTALPDENVKRIIHRDTIFVDSRYTFVEAIAGSNAPKHIIEQLQLMNVQYFSTDGKLHQGQILTNRKMVDKLTALFHFFRLVKFPIAHAIPIVKYNWNDNLSMQANNTYSFCYRNTTFSKHARGLALDMNPYFNPVRWKNTYKCRLNKPIGAIRDTTVNGTIFSSHAVVQEFTKLGFFWGHNYKAKYDDHHIEL